MSVKTRYIIVALLPKAVSEEILRLQSRNVNKSWQIIMPPHMTLLRPGYAKVDIDTAIKQFRRLHLHTNSIVMRSAGLGSFRSGKNANTAYIHIVTEQGITAVHTALLEQAGTFMGTKQEFSDFLPHVTLADEVEDESTLDQILADMKPLAPKIATVVTRIFLFKKSDNDPQWIKLASRPLT